MKEHIIVAVFGGGAHYFGGGAMNFYARHLMFLFFKVFVFIPSYNGPFS